jgi:hypothetical protein
MALENGVMASAISTGNWRNGIIWLMACVEE